MGGGGRGTKGIRAGELGGHRNVENCRAGEATPSGRIWYGRWKRMRQILHANQSW